METLSTIMAPVWTVLGMVLAGFVITLAKRGLATMEASNAIDLTAQQKQTVRDAINTAAGTVLGQLAIGRLALSDVRPLNDTVTSLAKAAYARVEGSAEALGGVTARTLAENIVGAVGNHIGADPTVPTVAVIAPRLAAIDQTFTPAIRPPV